MKTSPSRRKYGWKPQLPDQRDFLYKPKTIPTDLPKEVDMRGPIAEMMDQSDLGACTANWAAVGTWYGLVLKLQKQNIPALSRLFIYYNTRRLEHTTRTDSGASIRDTIKAVATYGACYESAWPYDIAKFAKVPPKSCYDAAKTTALIKTYEAVPQTLNAMLAALAEGLPIWVGATVYESFESDAVAKTGIVPMPGPKEQPLGGHAWGIVGYSMAKSWFICQNSWGPDWGDKGHFYIPFRYMLNPNLAGDFWIARTL